jgi:transposase
MSIPGVGPITAATIQALVPDPGAFTSGRHFATWIGLTPRLNSSGGKERIGKISKMGNPTLRSLLVVGATAVLQHIRRGATVSPWLTALLVRRPAKVAAIALANKMARITWALLTKGGTFIRKDTAAGHAAA